MKLLKFSYLLIVPLVILVSRTNGQETLKTNSKKKIL